MVNSLELYETLRSAHLPDPQARAIAQAVGSALADHDSRQEKSLATKVDQDRFGASMHRVEGTLRQIEASIAGLRGEFGDFRAETLAKFGETNTRIAETKSELMRWMFAFWIGQAAVVLTIAKLLK